ncbi:hypothetical protein OIO90_000978 [Microbotryomycetes sp. JL221]|nr:hypothetical protein OIO90_000978 [Microbotryomycetes sp. JL221]
MATTDIAWMATPHSAIAALAPHALKLKQQQAKYNIALVVPAIGLKSGPLSPFREGYLIWTNDVKRYHIFANWLATVTDFACDRVEGQMPSIDQTSSSAAASSFPLSSPTDDPTRTESTDTTKSGGPDVATKAAALVREARIFKSAVKFYHDSQQQETVPAPEPLALPGAYTYTVDANVALFRTVNNAQPLLTDVTVRFDNDFDDVDIIDYTGKKSDDHVHIERTRPTTNLTVEASKDPKAAVDHQGEVVVESFERVVPSSTLPIITPTLGGSLLVKCFPAVCFSAKYHIGRWPDQFCSKFEFRVQHLVVVPSKPHAHAALLTQFISIADLLSTPSSSSHGHVVANLAAKDCKASPAYLVLPGGEQASRSRLRSTLAKLNLDPFAAQRKINVTNRRVLTEGTVNKISKYGHASLRYTSIQGDEFEWEAPLSPFKVTCTFK